MCLWFMTLRGYSGPISSSCSYCLTADQLFLSNVVSRFPHTRTHTWINIYSHVIHLSDMNGKPFASILHLDLFLSCSCGIKKKFWSNKEKYLSFKSFFFFFFQSATLSFKLPVKEEKHSSLQPCDLCSAAIREWTFQQYISSHKPKCFDDMASMRSKVVRTHLRSNVGYHDKRNTEFV